MINQRTFGVEIECLSPFGNTCDPIRKTRDLLTREGFTDWAENVYYDGSEVEIPSPILKGAPGMLKLRSVMNLLVEKGYRVTSADGMHVHHGVHDLSPVQVKNVVESWMLNQELIKRLVSPSRRNGTWSRDLNSEDLDHLDYEIAGYKYDPNYDAYYDEAGNEFSAKMIKYKSLSLYSRLHQNTIEIRLHQGTLNFDKARAWILFGQAFITNVAKRKSPIKCASVEELLEKTGVYTSARSYLLSRERSLNES